MTPVSLDHRVRQCSDVETTDLSDALIVTRASQPSMFGVNGVGRRILQLLESPRTVQDIVTVLVREFRVEHQQCDVEVRAFLTELGEQELIQNC